MLRERCEGYGILSDFTFFVASCFGVEAKSSKFTIRDKQMIPYIFFPVKLVGFSVNLHHSIKSNEEDAAELNTVLEISF